MTQLLHIRRLIERGIKPDLVVVEIIPSMCADRKGNPPEIGHLRPDRVTPGTGCVDGYRLRERNTPRLERGGVEPWFGFRFQLLGMIQPKWTPPGVVKPPALTPIRPAGIRGPINHS